jgi:hypothetical protein
MNKEFIKWMCGYAEGFGFTVENRFDTPTGPVAWDILMSDNEDSFLPEWRKLGRGFLARRT